MPRRKSPPRLYFDQKRSSWVIRDGSRFIRTGFDRQQSAQAENRLAEYIGEKYAPPLTNDPTVIEVLATYLEEVVPHKPTAVNIGYRIGSLRRWWAGKKASEVNTKTCRAYAATKTQSAALQDLKTLRSALKHWDREHTKLPVTPTVWTPPPGEARDRWLTREELARLLWAARRTQHLRRFILLAYYTGSRPGVILRMQWDQIDLKSGVMARARRGEAVHAKKRSPRVRLGNRILAHLRRWKRLDHESVKVICHYKGRKVKDPHGSWKRVITKAKLSGVTRHTLRHTRATHLMQARANLWDAAGSLGMTIKTLETVYGHHHPDWQAGVANL